MDRLHSQPESQLAASWSARLQRLESALLDAPHSAQAWRWRVQVKVLHFLLARYGGRTDLDGERPRTETPTTPPESSLPDKSKPPMAPLKMRRVLVRVAQGNFRKGYDPLPTLDKPKRVCDPLTPSLPGKVVHPLLDPEKSLFARILLTDLDDLRTDPRLPRWWRVFSLLFLSRYFPYTALVLLLLTFALGVLYIICRSMLSNLIP